MSSVTGQAIVVLLTIGHICMRARHSQWSIRIILVHMTVSTTRISLHLFLTLAGRAVALALYAKQCLPMIIHSYSPVTA